MYIPINNHFKCQWTKCPMKRHKALNGLKEKKMPIRYLQLTHFRTKNTGRLKVKGRKKILH